jgi:hypothetical protein
MSLEREKQYNDIYTFRPVTNKNYKLKILDNDFYDRINK